MTKVDSKGRIVLPQELRDRLGITPGTEVTIHEEDGKAVVQAEPDPEDVLARMERLVEETSPDHDQMTPLTDGVDPIAQRHRNAVRKGAERDHE